MTLKKLLMTGLAAGAFMAPLAAEDAEARGDEYCREYTKSIRINGRIQSGYGQACQQRDGSWLIVSARGNVDPFDALRARNFVLVADTPVYFAYGPSFRPVRYYRPARYSYPPFFFTDGYYGYRHDNGYHRGWDRHDRDDDHDRDRGHDRDRDRDDDRRDGRRTRH